MECRTVKLTSLCLDPRFNFSVPLCPERYEGVERRFPGLPLLILDKESRLVSGWGYYHLLRQRNQQEAQALVTDLAEAEALILAYHSQEAQLGLNLYEQLLFVKIISSYLPLAEIRRRIALPFPLNAELLSRIDELLVADFEKGLSSDYVTCKTAWQLLDWPLPDRNSLLRVLESWRFSEAQQAVLLDLLQEIAFRDNNSCAFILQQVGIDQLLAKQMPQKMILAALHRLRYPAYWQQEDDWHSWLQGIHLPGDMQLSHQPFFERRTMKLQVTFSDWEKARNFVGKLPKPESVVDI